MNRRPQAILHLGSPHGSRVVLALNLAITAASGKELLQARRCELLSGLRR